MSLKYLKEITSPLVTHIKQNPLVEVVQVIQHKKGDTKLPDKY